MDGAKGAPTQRSSVLLKVAYDGRAYHGFARQQNARTIQGTLDGALCAVDDRASTTRGTSRTDAGVHALAHPVAFDPHLEIEPRGWVHAINRQLPDDIAVLAACRVGVGFEPRFQASHKTYRYLLTRSATRDPFSVARTWRVAERLNHEAMARAARVLVGEHDFRAFRGAQDEREHTVRRLLRVEVRNASSDDPAIVIRITGNGFLYKMVRIIVGSLVEIGRGRLAETCFERAFASKERTDLGITAPPEGLYLEHVELTGHGFAWWPEASD